MSQTLVLLKLCLTALALMICVKPAAARQPDAPFIAAAKKNREKWIQEDREVNARLTSLQQKFGKRPNIIYVRRRHRLG